jgi:prepilin-type N-terminal cleavage/methylation domain-containing protein
MFRKARAFSLVELVIVVVILGIIAAIAIPRMSRGAQGAVESRLRSDLAVLRAAINLYAAEHNATFPTTGNFVAQLTTYTDIDGNTSATRTGNYIYGPYIEAIPTLSVGSNKGKSGVAAATGATIGWIYLQTPGTINANLPVGELDSSGVPYASY